MYTVKQLSNLARVSVRTLHYYDEVDLLKPAHIGDNGYRYYSDDCLFRLQQILFYKELDFSLQQIKEIMDNPDFDPVSALQLHRQTLQQRIARLQTLINTVDTTIMHLLGEVTMSNKHVFKGFSEEEEQEYAQRAMQEYGEETVKASMKLWNSYSAEKKEAIKQEGSQIYLDLAANMDKGPENEAVQAILVRWHQHLRYFYEPSLATLRGLGSTYNHNPDFNANFTAIHPDLPPFLEQAINHYVDGLEKK